MKNNVIQFPSKKTSDRPSLAEAKKTAREINRLRNELNMTKADLYAKYYVGGE